jgi:CubicO group peptidase (beta-lactamase class C family)
MISRIIIILFLISIDFFGAAAIAFCQKGKDISGQWIGPIKTPGMELEIRVEFSKDSAGVLTGLMDIPMQGAVDLPVTDVRVEDDSVFFRLPGVPGDPTFAGIIAANADSLYGDFIQGGQKYQFALERKSSMELEAEARSLEDIFAKIRTYVDSTMKNWKTPGLALAIIKDKKTIFSEGFGYRNVKDSFPVTPQTIFAIGSSTKAFTTMAMGMLADEGKLEWDRPLREYLPDFRMKDELASQRITPRDLVTHRSGLPRHDLVWYNNLKAGRKDLVQRIQYLEPNKDFRTDFQYQNLMFLTAGYLIEQIASDSWENVIKGKIFAPLGMNSSNFSVLESMKSPDFALPYKEKNGVATEIPFRNITTMGPAGSINSNLNDLTKWVLFHLNDGRVNDSQLISSAMIRQMRTPYMAISTPQMFPEASNKSYGLGWFLESYRGHSRVYHGGNIDGFSALISFYPFDNIGIIVLTNMDGSPTPGIITSYAADLLFGLEPIDWNTRMKEEEKRAMEAKIKESEKEPDRVLNTKPTHKLADYAGEYENPGYGILEILYDGKALTGVYNDISARLEHWHYDVFRAHIEEFEDRKILFTFAVNAAGDIAAVSAPFEPLAPEIIFTRRPPREMRTREFLLQFAGEYEAANQIAKFELKSDTILTLSLPGQPLYDLEPYKETQFTIKGLTGYAVEFVRDKNNKVTEALFKQPEGVFRAARKK